MPGGIESAAVPAVQATGIHKQFGSTQALRGVDITLWPGRCLGLVGRNGAGKSTLVSILSGIYAADAGLVRFDGNPAPPLGAVGAWRSRIATVFQHSMVVPGLTVAENVFLGRQPRRSGLAGRAGLIDWRRMRAETRAIMAEWGYQVDAATLCGQLTVEQRQIVEIVRALAAGTRCLLLDEPTAALERGAIRRLFERVRQLTASGVAVLYISHHLEEVFDICQDVAVVRDGELVLTAPAADLSREQLVTAMVGSQVAAGSLGRVPSAPRAGPGAPLLAIEDVRSDSVRGPLRGVSLRVGAGERVGITGLLSAGVATLARVAAGAEPLSAGRVLLDGRPLVPGRRDLALRRGVGYIPEDRQAEGFVALLGVAENTAMTIADRLARMLGLLWPRVVNAAAAPLIRRLSIVASRPGQPVGELSGGNQQKVTAARALARGPRLIVAITPTRGVDVASKSLLLSELAEAAERDGAGLLLATDELDDLVICDRVAVLVRGEAFAEFTEPPFGREALIAATEGLRAGGRREPS